MSLSEHLTRSRTVNVFFLLLLETPFFLIKHGQLDRIVLISLLLGVLMFALSTLEHFILKGNTVNLGDQSEEIQ